jgi:enoyl-CoA hydratase/carnithine racemase
VTAVEASADLLVEHDRDRGLLTITFNRPARKNAITQDMWRQLRTVFTTAGDDPDVRAIVLTGTGDAFCSGADLGQLQQAIASPPSASANTNRMAAVTATILAVHEVPKPTVARVVGPAVGGGLGLALACDIVVAAESARFIAAFTRRALSPDSGVSWFLPRVVGLSVAKRLAFTAAEVDGTEAAALGIASIVVPDADIDRAVAEVVEPLLAGPTIALGHTKRLLNESGSLTLSEALLAEGDAQTANFATADNGEALAAFAAKRQPTFKGS